MSTEPAANNFDKRKPELSPQAAAVLKRLREAARQQKLENEARARGETPAEMANRGIRNLDPAHDDGAQDVFFPPASKRPQKRYAILVMVFVLSAAITGALGGLLLSMRGQTPSSRVAGKAHTTIIVRKQAGMNGMQPEAKPARTPVTTETDSAEATSGTVVVKKTSEGAPLLPPPPPLTSEQADAATPPAAVSGANHTPVRTVMGLKGGPATASVAAKSAKPDTNTSANPKPSAAVAGDDLEALTNNVVSALQQLNGGEGTGLEQTGNLRQALRSLVSKALNEGRDRREIAGLLDNAINKARAGSLPGALRGADGRIDTRQLIASVVPADSKTAATTDGVDRKLLAQLAREARETSMKPLPDGQTSRFFVKDGQRYTIIAPGDTLSGIAFAAYGDVLAYPLILRANAGKISVRNLKPGTRIIIPDKTEFKQQKGRPAGRTARRKSSSRRDAARNARRQARTRPSPAGRKAGQRKITDRLLGAIGALPASDAAAPGGNGANGIGKVPVTTNFKAATPAQ